MITAQAIQRAHNKYPLGGRDYGYADVDRDSLPAPVDGWNRKDSIANMKASYAVLMDNYFPELGSVRLRRGSKEFADVGDDDVETLFAFQSGTVKKFFAAAGTKIYDITDTPVTDAKTGLTNSQWDVAQCGLVAIWCNGEDTPQQVKADGTMADATYTGTDLTSSDLLGVLPFKNRVFFYEKNTATLWFTGAGAALGAVTKYDLGLVHPAGGNVKALCSITRDGGEGIDDLFVVFMDSGAVLVYQGTNPASATAWAIVGTFFIGKTIGRRPCVQYGPDVVVITEDGYVPLLPFLLTGRTETQLSLSDKINQEVSDQVEENRDEFGWQAVYYPPAKWLLINVPGANVQHVMNTQTSSWCQFRGMPALCWAEYDNKVYFGGEGGKVNQADTGGVDVDNAIIGEVQYAFNYMGNRNNKNFKQIRPLIESTASVQVAVGVAIDFDESAITATPVITSGGTPWNTQAWDSFTWAPGKTFFDNWQIVDQYGTTISLIFKTDTKGVRTRLFSADIMYENCEVNI